VNWVLFLFEKVCMLMFLALLFFFFCVFVAFRGAATLKARALKEVWNIAAVIPVERNLGISSGNGNGGSNNTFSGELVPEENFLDICSREYFHL
jgi:hypothetical protein